MRNQHIRRIGLLAAMAAAVCFAVPALAQQEQTPPPPLPGAQAPPPAVVQPNPRVQRLMKKIEEVKHQRLREELAMDDATAKKFFDVYNPAEKEIGDLVRQRTQAEQKLVAITQGSGKDADVDPTIASIKNINDKIEQRVTNLNDQLKPILNPRQRAKFLVFEHEFNSRVRQRIQQWRRNHPGRPFLNYRRGGGGGGPQGPGSMRRIH